MAISIEPLLNNTLTSDDALKVQNGGTLSAGNSSTTALNNAATYTGTGELNNYPDVMVSCKTDQSGVLYFDFSNDNSNWDTFPSSGFKVAASIHEFHTAVKGPRYFRVRFTNDSGSNQTYLRLYTYYGNYRQPNAPLNQALGLDADAILTRPTFPWLDAARNLVTGMIVVKKFGRNTAVGTSYSTIALGGNYRTPLSTAATTLRIKAGGNENDTANGTGAREVTLEGLDENFALATEAIATNGTSASSATTTTFTRLFRCYVSKSGTYATQSTGSHSAAITIENGSGGTNWAVIGGSNFPKGQSEIGAYTIPSGYTGYVFLDDVTVDTNKTTDLIFFSRGGADDTAAPYEAMRARSVLIGIKAPIQLQGRVVPLGPFVGTCDIGYMGKVDTGTASVAVEFEIFLVQET